MAKTKIDTTGLHAALDAERRARNLSWRQLSAEIGVTPSLLSRLGNKQRPDADGFVTLVHWLGLPAETFMINEDAAPSEQTEPDLVTQLAPLLRARQDLDARDIAYLEEVIRATVKHVQAARQDLE